MKPGDMVRVLGSGRSRINRFHLVVVGVYIGIDDAKPEINETIRLQRHLILYDGGVRPVPWYLLKELDGAR